MELEEQIRQGWLKMASKVGPDPTMLGTVLSVDHDEKTCVLTVDELDIPDIRLRPVVDNKEGLTIFPKPGTWALAVRIEGTDEYMIAAAGEVEKYRLVVADLVFEVGANKVTLKKGEDSLKDVLTLIIEAINQVVVIYGNNPAYDKLSQALTKVQNLFA